MASDLQTQYALETLYNKNQTLPRLRSEFRIPEVVAHCKEHGIPVDFAIDLMSQMVLHKRATVGMMIGLLARHCKDLDAPLQTCADMLLKAADVDLVDWDDTTKLFILKVDVSDDVYEDLEKYQYPLPMVVPPREVRNNRDTGYYTHRGSIILRDNHHDDDVCLDHINRVNRVKLRINADTARMVHNQWRHLDHQKDGETSTEYTRRIKAFEKYDRTARDVMEHLFIAGNEFYLTHKYDKRGRCYAQGYHVNYQGNAWNKAVVEFAEGEVVTGVITNHDSNQRIAA